MYYTYRSPRVFNVVLCAMSILSCFSLFAVELIFCFLVSHNKKSERWLQLPDLRLSRREEVGAKEKAIWVRCPNSIPAEIFPATPRSNTGQQTIEDKLGLGVICRYKVRQSHYFLWWTLHSTFSFALVDQMLQYQVFVDLFCFVFFLFRQPTQDPPEELRTRDFRRELEERERAAAREKTRERGPRGWFSFNIGYFNISIMYFNLCFFSYFIFLL